MLGVALKFLKAFQRLEDKEITYSIKLSNDTTSIEDWENITMFAKFLKKLY